MPNHYIISRERLIQLLRDEEMLSQLESWGVDNWSGYEEIDWTKINAEPDLHAFKGY